MGQQPNIELDGSDLPQATTERAPERRWSPSRPGEITSPADMPDTAAFGRPGPDTGWALRLLGRTPYDRAAIHPHGEAVLVALMSARAAHFGRAPTPDDVTVALTLFGLRTDGLGAAAAEALVRHRSAWLQAAAHEWSKGTAAVAAVPIDVLSETPIHLRTRLNDNPSLLD